MSYMPMEEWAEQVLKKIKQAIGIPPASTAPVAPAPSASPTGRSLVTPNPQAFPLVSKAQADLARGKAIVGKKPVPFSGMAGYSERGAPQDWDTAMGEVFGYRWWYLIVRPELVGYVDSAPRVTAADYQPNALYGANNQRWKDGRQEAICTKTGSLAGIMNRAQFLHRPPEIREACGCGYWAYFNKGLTVGEVMVTQFAAGVPPIFSYGAAIPVFGVIKGTGRVIIGEKGFRCQYAQIMGLCIPPVAVSQLGWWIYRNERVSYYSSYWRYGSEAVFNDKVPCTKAEHVTRVSEMEVILTSAYPNAKIFSGQDLLTQYFPPDKNYA